MEHLKAHLAYVLADYKRNVLWYFIVIIATHIHEILVYERLSSSLHFAALIRICGAAESVKPSQHCILGIYSTRSWIGGLKRSGGFLSSFKRAIAKNHEVEHPR